MVLTPNHARIRAGKIGVIDGSELRFQVASGRFEISNLGFYDFKSLRTLALRSWFGQITSHPSVAGAISEQANHESVTYNL
jgi:hypothetical protein